jgi:hypothetical protein
MSFRVELYHFINGIRSGIPACCVLFFTKKNRTVDYVAYEVDKERGINVKSVGGAMTYPDGKPTDAEYVQCDTCFKNNRVEPLKSNGCIMHWLYPRD